jgi:GTP-binding protein EngB required for normal cell division
MKYEKERMRMKAQLLLSRSVAVAAAVDKTDKVKQNKVNKSTSSFRLLHSKQTNKKQHVTRIANHNKTGKNLTTSSIKIRT